MDWVRHAIWWHVYPLGFTGAHPDRGDGADHSLRRIVGWLLRWRSQGHQGRERHLVRADAHGQHPLGSDRRLGDDSETTERLEILVYASVSFPVFLMCVLLCRHPTIPRRPTD